MPKPSRQAYLERLAAVRLPSEPIQLGPATVHNAYLFVGRCLECLEDGNDRYGYSYHDQLDQFLRLLEAQQDRA